MDNDKFVQITFIQHSDVLFSNKQHLFRYNIHKQNKQFFQIQFSDFKTSFQSSNLAFRFKQRNKRTLALSIYFL